MRWPDARDGDIADLFFFFNDTATTEIYTLSLHDALPICVRGVPRRVPAAVRPGGVFLLCGVPSDADVTLRADAPGLERDRKSTRLNSSHANISYAVFCLQKKSHHRERASQAGAVDDLTIS